MWRRWCPASLQVGGEGESLLTALLNGTKNKKGELAISFANLTNFMEKV
jgi:hypothetical protein